jgi:hypothetical protein
MLHLLWYTPSRIGHMPLHNRSPRVAGIPHLRHQLIERLAGETLGFLQ